jgi:hypothetical protein
VFGRVPASQRQLIALLSKLTPLAHAMQVDNVKKPLYCVPYALAEQAVYDTLLQMKTPEETEQFANLMADAVSKCIMLPRQTFEILAGVAMERPLTEDSRKAIHHVVNAMLEKRVLEVGDVLHSTEHFIEMGYRTVWESREFLSSICRANQCTEEDKKAMGAQSPLPLASCEVISAAREFIEKNSGRELSPKPIVHPDLHLWEDDAYRYVRRVTAIMHGVRNFEDVPVHDLEEGDIDKRYFHVEPKGGGVPLELLVDYKKATRDALGGKGFESVAQSRTERLASAMASRICEIARAEAMELEAIVAGWPERGVYPAPVKIEQAGITDTPDEVFMERMGPVLGARFIEIKQALLAEIAESKTLTAFNQLSAEELYALFAMKRSQLFDFCAPVYENHFQLGLCAYRMQQALGDCKFQAREAMRDGERRAELVDKIETAIGMQHTTNDSFAFTIFGGEGSRIRDTVEMLELLNALERGGLDSKLSDAEQKSGGINTRYYLWNKLYDEQELNNLIRIEKPQILQDMYQCRKVRFTESNINEAIRRGHFVLDLIPERADQFTKDNMLVLIDEYLKPILTPGKRIPRMFGYYPPEQEKLVRRIAFMEAMDWIMGYLGDKIDQEVAMKFAEIGVAVEPFSAGRQPAWTQSFGNVSFREAMELVECSLGNKDYCKIAAKFAELGVAMEPTAADKQPGETKSFDNVSVTTIFVDEKKDPSGYLAALQREVRSRNGLSALMGKLKAFNADGRVADDPDSRALAKISGALREIGALDPDSILPSTNPARPPTLDRHMPMLQNGAMNAFVRAAPGIYLESQCSGSETVYAVMVESELARKDGDKFQIDEKELISWIKEGRWAIYRVNENGFVSDIPQVYEILSDRSNAVQELDALTQEWRERFAALVPAAFPLKLKLVSFKPNEVETVSARTGKVNFKDAEPSLTFIVKLPHEIADMFEETLGKYPRLLEAASSVPEATTATADERRVFEAYVQRLALPDKRNPWLEFHGKADGAG